MNLTVLASVAATAFLIAPARIQFPRDAESQNLSKLTFAWPERVSAVIETTRRGVDLQASSAVVSAETRLRYRLEVVPDPSGRLLRFSDPEWLSPGDGTLVRPGDARQLIDQRWTPALIVDMRGEVIRILRSEAIEAAMQERVRSEPSVQSAPAVREQLEALASRDSLLRQVREEWDAIIGAWIGLPTVGGTVSREGNQPNRLSPGDFVPYKEQVGVVTASACMRDRREYRCVTLERKRVYSQFLGLILDPVRRKDLKPPGDFRSEMVEVSRLTVEVDTMLPHAFTRTRTISMVLPERTPTGISALEEVKFTYQEESRR